VTYLEDVKAVAEAHADEIRADLSQTQLLLRQSQSRAAELQQQVAFLGTLLDLLGGTPADHQPVDALTLHGAMAVVLRDQPGRMLRPADLVAEINRRRLYRMRDGRPVELQQIHARVGNYPQLFSREGTFIKLVDDSATAR
jgi:hypothetical protein